MAHGTEAPLFPRVADELLGAHAHRRARRTGAHAGGPPGQVLAHVALHRLLADLVVVIARLASRLAREPGQEPRPEAGRAARRIDLLHLDRPVGAVALAVAAADAGRVDEDRAVDIAVYRVRRTVLHAVRVLAMPARDRDMDVC